MHVSPALRFHHFYFLPALAGLILWPAPRALGQTTHNPQNPPHSTVALEAVDHEQIVPYWTTETGWRSELQLRNNLVAQALTVTPALRAADGTETPLAAVSVNPQEVKSIDIEAAVASSAPQLIGAYGSLVLRYHSVDDANLYAVLMVRNIGHPFAFHIDGSGEAEAYQAASREGVWWLPNDTANDYLILTNQGKNPLNLELSLFDASGKESKQKLALSPRATSRYSVRQLVRGVGLPGSYGGIKVFAAAHAGSLDTLHVLFDEKAAFSAILKMFDQKPNATIKERDYARTGVWTLRAPMLALSSPDPALRLPAGTVLQPQLFIRNTTAKPIDAALRFNWRNDTATGKAPGPALHLNGYETRRIDVAALQDGKTLPKEAHWTSVTLTTNALPDEVMAVAASYDQTLRYGAQTPFSDQLAFHWEGSMWEYDAQHDSIITAGNGGTKTVQAAFTIYYDQGTQRYDLEQTLQPDEQMWIDVGKLIQQQVPDKKGKTLPPDLTSGAYEFRDLTNKAIGALFEGKVIYDKTYGHVAYGCAGCCGYSYIRVWFDPLGIPFTKTSGDGVDADDSCSGQQGVDVSGIFYGNWTTANTSIATVNYYGTHTGVSLGSTTSQTYGELQVVSLPKYNCPISGRSPGGNDNVTPTVDITGASNFAFVGSDPTVPKVSQQAVGKPTGGTYSWTATPSNRISFDNPSADVVQMSGTSYSTSVGDTTITVNYTVNAQPVVSAALPVTSRLFKFLQQSGSIQVIPINGPPNYGYTSYVYYNVYTYPGGQILQPGFGGISVYESVTLTNTNFPVTEVTGTGSTTQNSQVVDQLSVYGNSPLPSNFSATSDQYLGVGGFIVRHNTITQTANGPSITNLGPYN